MLHGPWLADMVSTYFSGKTVKAMAMTSAHVPSVDTAMRSTLTGELVGGGYVAGGVTVTGIAAAWDSTEDRVAVTCDVVDFGAVTAADVGAVVFYLSTGDAATDRVLWTDTFPTVVAEGSLAYQPEASAVMEIRP